MSDAIVGYLHGGTVRTEFCISLLLLFAEGKTRIRSVIPVESGPNLSDGRNLLCRTFLTEYDEPWLFMCDSDMGFAGNTLDCLIAAADPVERPVVGALCWRLNRPDGVARYPTLYNFTTGPNGGILSSHYSHFPRDTLMRVDGTGAACLLIHRSALESVEKTSGDRSAPWFRQTDYDTPGLLLGEDLTFCVRLAAAGVPVHVHTGVKTGHVKTVMLI